MRAITVCIEYDDLLAITLPRNVRHFKSVLVVTSFADRATVALVDRTPGAEVYRTDAFYRDGAAFNKGVAIESGLRVFNPIGHTGARSWLCVLDADCLLPEDADFSGLVPGNLYCPRRRMLYKPQEWSPELDWSELPRKRDVEHAGYCQVFHAADPVLRERPWYPTGWRHAGGCDSDFQAKWPKGNRLWLDWECLHLGGSMQNWCGRQTPRLDGQVPLGAEARKEAMRRLHADRRETGGFERERLPRQNQGQS